VVGEWGHIPARGKLDRRREVGEEEEK